MICSGIPVPMQKYHNSIFMKRFKEDFPLKLKGIDFDTLENNHHSIYGLSKDLKLIYFNPSFVQFALANVSTKNDISLLPLGIPIADVLAGERVRDFYLENYERVIASGQIWHHEYECSSPNEYRLYHQRAYPLKDGKILIVINKLVDSKPMSNINRKANKPVLKHYLQDSGFITQCCNCRYVQRHDQPVIWDWVPDWVKTMPDNTSHSICPICSDYFWKYSFIKYPATVSISFKDQIMKF